jgi:hypothetical protein
MDDLELQFVRVAEFLKIFLAREQRLGIQIEFVVERSFTIHDRIKEFPVHSVPSLNKLSQDSFALIAL